MATSSLETKMATAKAVLTAAASVAGSIMLARSLARDFLPGEFQDYIWLNINKFLSSFSSQLTMVIDEFHGLENNQIYEAAEVYLGSKISPSSTQRFNVSKAEKEEKLTVKLEQGEEIVDIFLGVKFRWVLVCRQIESKNFFNPRDYNSTLRAEVRSYEVSFSKKHKKMVLETYLPHIAKEAKSLMEEKKTIKIFTVQDAHMFGNIADAWQSMNLDHPATFDTLALDAVVKDTILKDLDRFLERKEYYRKIGKAWKRGYLLYGPPGTGKSSLIAAMANYLKFDIYDLELTQIRSNSDLRKLLVGTANRSILVVEDIDCTIELHDRLSEAKSAESSPYPQHKQVTLSGFLNFIDGLWSSCGDERIIVFTTNHKDKLDPALLRPGRMDVHVHMSYCSPCGFRTLVANYLGITDHKSFREVEELIRTTHVTPAEVAEQLMRGEEVDVVLNELIEFLKGKQKETDEENAKKKKTNEEEHAECDKDGEADDDEKSKISD